MYAGFQKIPASPVRESSPQNTLGHELQDIDSSNNEGTNCLVNGRIGWFVVRSRTTGAIKLAMAGT